MAGDGPGHVTGRSSHLVGGSCHRPDLSASDLEIKATENFVVDDFELAVELYVDCSSAIFADFACTISKEQAM